MDKDLINKAYDLILKDNSKGYIKTGLNSLDNFFAPYKKGTFITVASRPAMGKTTFFMNLIENFLKQGKKCIYLISEQSEIAFTSNFLAFISKIDIKKIQNKKFSDEDLSELENAKSGLQNFDLKIFDNIFLSLSDLKEIIKSENPDYIFVDKVEDFSINKIPKKILLKKIENLERENNFYNENKKLLTDIMESLSENIETFINFEDYKKFYDEFLCELFYQTNNSLSDFEWENLSSTYFIEQLKRFTHDYGTITFVSSMLKRSIDMREDHYPKLSDLKFEVLNKSDVVIGLYRDEYYNYVDEKIEIPSLKISFLKNKLGSLCMIDLPFDKATRHLKESRIQSF